MSNSAATETLDQVMDAVEYELGSDVAAPNGGDVAAKAPSFPSFSPVHQPAGRALNHLLGVKLDAEVVLGRANLSVDDVLDLGIGSVVELDRQVSEPVDLIVQNVRVARGEVVVVNDQFAVRITEITGNQGS